VTTGLGGFKISYQVDKAVQNDADVSAQHWAEKICTRVDTVLKAHPEADRDNVRHTLILLEQPPLERLQRSLIRGRAAALFRK
jgi:hypothetical protein